MTAGPDAWARVKHLFQHAQAIEDPRAREAFLASECGRDAALRERVERLLRASGSAGTFLEAPAPAVSALAELARSPAPPVTRIGPYTIEREIGSGGMGTVYLARHDGAGFDRQVALKVVRRGMDTDFILRRFATERQILAGLEHPGIARLYDGGTTDDGRPYFAMEYVAGETLPAYCEAKRVGVEGRLRLFRRVCDAVQYAHQNLIVHRDLKPSNILVTADGEPRLLDFGIAKLLVPGAEGEVADQTMSVVRLLTPEYASPEQVRGERVTTASDVYSLGAILYELLAGRRPYTLTSRASSEIERAVLEQEPVPPSAAAADAALRLPGLRSELDAIVLKALQKDPARRYATAAELSDDIGRYLDGRPVHARPDSAAYRAGKFIRRHRVPVIAAAVTVLSLVAGLVVSVRERARAEQRFNDVRRLANSLVFELHDAVQFLPGSTAARQLIVKRALEYVDRLAADKPRDLALRRELAAAYYRLAEVQGNSVRANLGDTAGALASYEKALKLREDVAAETGDPDDVQLIADVEFGIATLQIVRDDAGARAAFTRVVDRLEALLRGPEPRQDPRGRLVAAYQRLAFMANAAFDGDEAARLVARAVVHAEAMVRQNPADVKARYNLAMVYREQAESLGLRKKHQEALARLRESRRMLEGLMAENPHDSQLTSGVLFTINSEGTQLERLGDAAGALAAYEHGLGIARQAALRDPKDSTAQLGVAFGLRNIGELLAFGGRVDQARSPLEESRDVWVALVAADPASSFKRDNLATTSRLLGEARRLASDAAVRARACAAFAEAVEHWSALESRNMFPAGSALSLQRAQSRMRECRGAPR